MADTSPTTPGRIFISYRREDTAYPAGWLYDRLADRFDGDKIFKDIDSIEPGDDFVEVITTAVGSCDVLLALIGRQWLKISDDEGKRRVDDPADFVRVEIEAALARNVRVVPVLVDGASMPRADELPASLARLTRRQALELSPSRFDFDLGRLLRVLDRTLADMQATRAAQEPNAAVLTFLSEQGRAVQRRSPSTELIRQLVSELSLPGDGNAFLIIQRDDRTESYAQVARNSGDDYLVEYRDGDAGRHFIASHLSLLAAQAALCGWAFDLPGWRDQSQWARLTSTDTTATQAADLGRARSSSGTWVPSGRSTQDAAAATTAPSSTASAPGVIEPMEASALEHAGHATPARDPPTEAAPERPEASEPLARLPGCLSTRARIAAAGAAVVLILVLIVAIAAASEDGDDPLSAEEFCDEAGQIDWPDDTPYGLVINQYGENPTLEQWAEGLSETSSVWWEATDEFEALPVSGDLETSKDELLDAMWAYLDRVDEAQTAAEEGDQDSFDDLVSAADADESEADDARDQLNEHCDFG